MNILKNLLVLLCTALCVFSLSAAGESLRVSIQTGNECCRFLQGKGGPNAKIRLLERKTRTETMQTLLMTAPVSGEWQDFEFSFVPDRNGMVTMILTSGKNSQWTEYTGFKAQGCKISNGDFKRKYNGFFWLWAADPVCVDEGFCSANFRVGVSQGFRVTKNVPVVIRFKARAGKTRKIPQKKPAFKYNEYHKFPGAELRYEDKKVKYLGLSHKGLTPENHPYDAWGYVQEIVKPGKTSFVVLPGKSGGKLDVPFELLEEDGIARKAPIRFGIPLAKGQFKQLGGLCVTDPRGKRVPAQFAATAFWPDGSVKMALVQFTAPLKARERSVWHVRTGKNPSSFLLKYKLSEQGGFVDTGRSRFNISRGSRFLSREGVSARIVLTDEQGKKQIFTPAEIRVEESGSRRVTLRLEGDCGNSFKTVVRLGFSAGSPVVSLDMRFINDCLKSEFTDIASLELFLDGVKASAVTMDSLSGKKFFQHHDRKLDWDGKFSDRRLSGCGTAGSLRFKLTDFWQKYPKSVSVSPEGIVFGLLPRQPGKDFNKELPFYLYYPFCGGFYRTKWGMAFSEKLSLDFSGKEDLSPRDIVPVIDRDYLASTKVFQGVPDSSYRLFDILDQRAVEAFSKIGEDREKRREYGFMNWGDSFGERGMNWNNNEYDLARGLFQIFLRTGNRDLYRYALISIRHQADVDIVHASIMKSNVGGQHQHSIGHSGPSWHHFRPLPWSYPHDANSTGLNGHTWTEGMLTGWCLAGDPFVMDSAHLMAAHFVNYTSRTFVNMRNNERSIGWALRAIMPFYRLSGDKKYIRAAADMVDVVKHEYEPAHGGAWPHKLKGGHANGHKDAWGGCPFMVGVMLEGLRQYQLEAGDPEVEKMIRGAARWLYKSYSPSDVGWPYGASWDGKGYHEPFVQCNFEVLSGMLYGLPESYDAVCDVIGQAALGGISSVPKDFSMVLNMSAGILDGLCRTRPDLKKVIDGKRLWNRVASKTSPFKVRGPVDKKFIITITGKNPEAVFRRSRYGGRPDGEKTYTIRWNGKTVTGKTATAHAEHKIVPAGKIGEQITVDIHDDLTSYWNLRRSKDVHVAAVVVPGYHLVADGTKAYSFKVPAGTKEFSIQISGTHRGGFAAAVLRPDGSIAQSVIGRNDGDVQLPWVKKVSRNRPEKVLTVKRMPTAADEEWKIVLLSGGGAGLVFKGIPPEISMIR